MEKDDVQLVRKILSGDDEAFNALVRKYQKGVHALAWRKVGDFHFAEEITQDVFLQVYKSLPTLKDPHQFVGWLYVITDRLCIDWLRKRKLTMQSLEDTPVKEIDKSSYTHYLSEQRETETTEGHSELVKKLLEKLPESERTVVTLYYLGEMTTQEIGKFLGVSVNTITSRLRRARARLQKEEELLIQEGLRTVQLSPNLTDSIMQQVGDIELTIPPTGTKPLLPWTAFGAAAALILLVLGVSNRYLVRFQKPYSFEAASEPTVEIVDAPVVQDIDAKLDNRNQAGRAGTTDKNKPGGLQTAKTLLTSDAQGDSLISSIPPRPKITGPPGNSVFDIFATSDGTFYAATSTGIYKLLVNTTVWTLVNTHVPTDSNQMSMAEHRNSLYIVSKDEIFASNDKGETWNAFCPRPAGHVVGLIVTDAPQDTSSLTGITMYLALRDKGVFRSTDAGTRWDTLSEGLAGKRIYTIATIGNTAFVGTNEGLYRLNAGVWDRVSVDTFKVN